MIWSCEDSFAAKILEFFPSICCKEEPDASVLQLEELAERVDEVDSITMSKIQQQILGTLELFLMQFLELFNSLSKVLRNLKPVLRTLNNLNYSNLTLKVRDQTEKVSALQRQLLSVPSPVVVENEKYAQLYLLELRNAEEKVYRQKSRVRWLKLGDRNSSFFHKTVTAHETRNHIHYLLDNSDHRLVLSSDLKNHVVDYFRDILGNSSNLTPCSQTALESLSQYICSPDDSLALTKQITDEEIRSTLFSLPYDICPGPDGYTAECYKSVWCTVSNLFLGAVREFFYSGKLLRYFNNTAIALIPKSTGVARLRDFRLISCCNVPYKVISKLLENRLKPILVQNISKSQSAFLKGRKLGDNVLLASELIRDFSKPGTRKSSVLKIDLRKAFDMISWDFIFKLLKAQNFPITFIGWIRECITTPRFSIMLNGELTWFFSGKRVSAKMMLSH